MVLLVLHKDIKDDDTITEHSWPDFIFQVSISSVKDSRKLQFVGRHEAGMRFQNTDFRTFMNEFSLKILEDLHLQLMTLNPFMAILNSESSFVNRNRNRGFGLTNEKLKPNQPTTRIDARGCENTKK